MNDEPAEPGHRRIDAAELSRVDVTDGGLRFSLRVRDRDGHHASVSLPVACVNTILTALPSAARDPVADLGTVHRLDGWSMDRGGSDLLLTLQLPDGARITFAVKPYQIAAMASLAEQGAGHRRMN